MKKRHILISSILCVGLSSCFDMNQEPQGELASSEAFSTVAEMQTYLNMFYQNSVPVSGSDGGVTNSAIKTQSSSQSNGIAFGDMASDNLLPATLDARLAGQMSSIGSVLNDYRSIRNINFLLQNKDRCQDQESASYKQCLGEAYYFRAAYYYNLLKDYGGVTWIDTPLDPDAALMNRPRNTRTELTEKILYDLDLAIENLSEQSSNATGRVHRDVARALKSEVALFAATWEKYHREDNDPFYDKTLTDPEAQITAWLNEAVEAAEGVMRGVWSISRQNEDPLTDYRDLFITLDLTGNQEVLWWKQYNAPNVGNNVTYYNAFGGGGKGVSASLVDDYLTRDGKPFVGEEKENTKLVYGAELDPELRDPRLSQTVFMPGQPMQDDVLFEWPPIDRTDYNQNTTGYSLLKHHEFKSNGKANLYGAMSWGETPAIQVRYADVLLNYAEALAELDGAANASRIQEALRPLRERVGMPGVDFEREYNTDPDYPFHYLDPYIQAVRRERRVEKAAENCRLTDILRWSAADDLILGKFPIGARYTGTTLEEHFGLSAGNGLWLNDEGYIYSCDVSGYPDGWQFNLERDYLLPIREEMLGPNGLTGGAWENNPNW